MAKRKAESSIEGNAKGVSRRRSRLNPQPEVTPTTSTGVKQSSKNLFRNADSKKFYHKCLKDKHILEYKYANLADLINQNEHNHLEVYTYLALQGWDKFAQVDRPISKTLLRILIANLEEDTMMSCIGKIKVDLSTQAWCNTFGLPQISEEEEQELLEIPKEHVISKLTGQQRSTKTSFIKINDLPQEANIRLSAQVVTSIIVPKKGGKEQLKIEDGRVLLALLHGYPLSIARVVIERLKSVYTRKSSPICYGMHLMELMERSGVDLNCLGDNVTHFNSAIDYHTLRRLGYRLHKRQWVHTGKGKMNEDQDPGLNDPAEKERLESDPVPTEDQNSQDPQPSTPHSESNTQQSSLNQVDLTPILNQLQAHFIQVNGTLSALRTKINHTTADLNFFKAEAYTHFSETRARLDAIELALANQTPLLSSPVPPPKPQPPNSPSPTLPSPPPSPHSPSDPISISSSSSQSH